MNECVNVSSKPLIVLSLSLICVVSINPWTVVAIKIESLKLGNGLKPTVEFLPIERTGNHRICVCIPLQTQIKVSR